MAIPLRYAALIPMICLLLGWTVQAQPRRPFSHKYHLQQVSQCQACHVDAEKSTKADDNLLPFHDACARCHDETHIREPRQLNVQKFNHAVHVAMGNVRLRLRRPSKRATTSQRRQTIRSNWTRRSRAQVATTASSSPRRSRIRKRISPGWPTA